MRTFGAPSNHWYTGTASTSHFKHSDLFAFSFSGALLRKVLKDQKVLNGTNKSKKIWIETVC